MKLLTQARLLFQEGKSDKVYEVDLLEVSPGQCVVNFRYGRRGASLKDGTKTPAPVPEAEARKVFDKLVQSKVTSGYQPEGAPGSTAAPPPPTPAAPPLPPLAPGEDPRERVLLEQLRRAASTPVASTVSRWFRRNNTRAPKTRSLERIVWRLGELRVRAAEPLLLPLLERATPLRAYCIVAALGRLGSEASVPTLGRLYADPSTPDMVRRMATEALLQLSDEATRAEFRRDEQQKLPAALRLRLEKPDAPGFGEVLEEHLSSGSEEALAVLEPLYRVDAELARPAFLKALRTLPFQVASVRVLRHLFKMAEYRRDGEVFGLIAWRYEKERPLGSQYVRAFRRETRQYLRRRVWRTLRELGEAQSPEYVRMAVGVLLPFQDTDALASSTFRTGRDERHSGAWWPYWAFNQVLYRE
ncbi:MAG: HEAT repeat domain-containing protein, partial [Cystobacter sp.]